MQEKKRTTFANTGLFIYLNYIPGSEAFKGTSNALQMNVSRCSCRKNKEYFPEVYVYFTLLTPVDNFDSAKWSSKMCVNVHFEVQGECNVIPRYVCQSCDS